MIKRTIPERLFNVCNIAALAALLAITLYPFYYVLCASFSDNTLLKATPGLIFQPLDFKVGAYRLALQHPLLTSGYANTFFVLGAGLPLNLAMTVLCAFFLASKGMMWKKAGIFLVMFTMFFGGGLIPTYLNIQRLGLINSLWALILPGAFSVYNAIITKTAMEAIPESLAESAFMDGANDYVVLVRITLPLIVPTLAVMLLYYGVGHWNSWFSATIYLKDNDKMPLQAVLRSILIANSDILGAQEYVAGERYVDNYAESIKYAVIVISAAPILCVYPFLQRYFVKGVMIGAVKG